jgi:UDP-N-acetylglucosamine--N-acetylmuramyl-(pentapeptide) pyrophosphoryl-undecaprenol N-acetylglucosamine transferase
MAETFFIAAGGTGGHIYPGIALAEALKEQDADNNVLFIGTPHGLENKLVKAKGYEILHLNIGRLNKNVSRGERLKTFLQLPLSFLKSFSLLRKYKPKVVIGVGGHASGPMLLMAALLRTPTVIWEPNAMPGMANRWLARFVDLACVVFEEAKRHLHARRFMVVGLPLRAEIERLSSRQETKDPAAPFRVLVFGGSQGARGLNKVTLEFLQKNSAWLKDNEIIHQTGAAEEEGVKNSYADLKGNPHLKVVPYIEDMAAAYQWADVVVCRSGTGTLAELAALGKPSVLIPFPFASDNHQQKNAEAFADENAALMILQKDLTPPLFGETLQKLKADRNLRETLGRNSRKFFKPHAAQEMAREILKF